MDAVYQSLFGWVMVFLFLLSFPLVLQFTIWVKTKGHFLCAILEKDKPLSLKLIKVSAGELLTDGEDTWLIESRQIKLVKYPVGFPSFLGMFQRLVPCSLYLRGRETPLDWEDPIAGPHSSKELGEVLDPYWLKNLVHGIGEMSGFDKKTKMMSYLAVGASVICMILIFVVLYKMGSLEQSINLLY